MYILLNFKTKIVNKEGDAINIQSRNRLLLRSEDKMPESKIQIGDLEIDIITHSVLVKRKKIMLTNLEFNLLLYLASQPGRVFTYQQIYEAVWNEPYAFEKGNIMTHIRHLREKIDFSSSSYIENIRGVGYRFVK